MILKWQLWLFPLTFNFHIHSLRLWQVSLTNKLYKSLHWCSYIHIFFNVILDKVNKQVDINHLVPDRWLGRVQKYKVYKLICAFKEFRQTVGKNILAQIQKELANRLQNEWIKAPWVNSPRKIYCKEVISDPVMTEWVNKVGWN